METKKEYFNELKYALIWVKSFLHADFLSIEDIEHVLAFLLVWNIFEGNLFDNDHRLGVQSLSELGRVISPFIEPESICDAYDFFADRYFGPNGDTIKFNNLQLEKTAKKYQKCSFDGKTDEAFVRFVFKNKDSIIQDKLVAVLLVALRFRNNLFHGLKHVDKFKEYRPSFLQINKILRVISEECPRNWRNNLT